MALILLGSSGPDANGLGFLIGALAGPVLALSFVLVDSKRRAGGTYGDWRWLSGRATVAVVALAGWLAGAAHAWFLAQEVTRWVAG